MRGDATYLLATPPPARVSTKTAPWNCSEVSGYRGTLPTIPPATR